MTYTVKAGDTLSQIAKDFGVTVEALVEAYGIKDPSLIRVGQVLVIPPAKRQSDYTGVVATQCRAHLTDTKRKLYNGVRNGRTVS